MDQYASAQPMDFLLALQYKGKVSTHCLSIQQLWLFLGFKHSVNIITSNTFREIVILK